MEDKTILSVKPSYKIPYSSSHLHYNPTGKMWVTFSEAQSKGPIPPDLDKPRAEWRQLQELLSRQPPSCLAFRIGLCIGSASNTNINANHKWNNWEINVTLTTSLLLYFYLGFIQIFFNEKPPSPLNLPFSWHSKSLNCVQLLNLI
jgi:hypothetical protein